MLKRETIWNTSSQCVRHMVYMQSHWFKVMLQLPFRLLLGSSCLCRLSYVSDKRKWGKKTESGHPVCLAHISLYHIHALEMFKLTVYTVRVTRWQSNPASVL